MSGSPAAAGGLGAFCEHAPCERSHARNLTVPKGSKAVHPSGHPMSHSTHVGFSGPPPACRPAPPSFLTASVRLMPGCALLVAVFLEPELFASPAVGVGHRFRRAMVDSDGAPAVLNVEPSGLLPLFRVPYCCAVGVGSNDPDAVSLVRRSGVSSSQHSPPRIVPQRGKVTEDHGKSSANKERAVLHEDEARSNLADDARHLSPQAAALSGDTGATSGGGDVLAREASRHHVNTPSPRSSVKGSHVIPNRERREGAVVLPCDQYACGVGVLLDGADGSPPEQVATEDASTSAREKSQLIHFLPTM